MRITGPTPGLIPTPDELFAKRPVPPTARDVDLDQLRQLNPGLYQKLLNEQKIPPVTNAPGGIPGMPGNAMGMQVANVNEAKAAEWRRARERDESIGRDGIKFGLGTHSPTPPMPVPPAISRDMQGTQLVPQSDGSYIHPALAGSENEAYRQRFIEAMKNR